MARSKVAAVFGASSLVMALVVGGCGPSAPAGGGSTTGGTTPRQNAPAAVTMESLAGEWAIDTAAYEKYAGNMVRRMLAQRGVPVTDAAVAEGVAEVAGEIASNPPVFVLGADGALSIRMGETVATTGTWTLEGQNVTMTVTEGMNPGAFRHADGRLVSVPAGEGEVEVALIKR